VPEVATAASELFLEVLATYDMAQRGFLDGRTAPPPDAPGPRPRSRGRAPRPGAEGGPAEVRGD